MSFTHKLDPRKNPSHEKNGKLFKNLVSSLLNETEFGGGNTYFELK